MKTSSAAVVRGLALGLIAGVMSGLFGIGGGAVLVPLLVLWVALGQHRAHATSLAAIILTASAGALRFAAGDAVAFLPGLGVAAGAVAGAFLGAGLMHRLSPLRLRLGFAILLLIVSVQMLTGWGAAENAAAAARVSGVAAAVGFVALGLVAGVLSAVMGVGGGVIMVPAMVLLFGLDQHTAEGTSLLVIVPTAIAGSIRHTRNGYTDWGLGALVGVGGIAGALLGAEVALSLDGEVLRRLFAVFLLITAVRMLWSQRRPTSEPADVEVD